ncbi:MAG: GH116 family glycosyl hydrolase [Bacteroidia bacterium]|nr:GH116 family glycosyl hydrolase [Bacteroidia bacterium]
MKATQLVLFGFFSMLVLNSCNSDNPNAIEKRTYNGFYTGSNLNKIAFPIGGIGAGMFCLEGTGAISQMSVRNSPDISSGPFIFAAISLKGVKNGAKVLEGQIPEWKIFGRSKFNRVYSEAGWGLPRFEDTKFLARFPFAYIDLYDNEIPLKVQIKGWSPFIPTDADDSSLPIGAIEYSFKNTGNSKLEAVFSYNSINFMRQTSNIASAASGSPTVVSKASIKPIPNGFILSEEGVESAPYNKGDFAIFTNEPNTIVDYCWFRGGHFDGITMLWNTIASGDTKSNPPIEMGAPGASLYVPFTLKPGETKVVRLMMAWYVPNTTLRSGRDPEPVPAVPCCETNYKPWYTSKFKDIYGVVNFWKTSYNDLHKKSEQFKDAFFASTLPAEVIEAVAANLSILKSPTILRQADGRIWGWEGCYDDKGCCAGSCTHVWNYAQAIPHLFPQLERTLRETEFLISQDTAGHQAYRSALPIRAISHRSLAASDGQLGGIIKVYRDWRIMGDKEWLKNMYPFVVRSLDYSIKSWDPRSTGTIEEPHHNTYDIEFWGPDPMCTSFYLAALKAISEMGKYLGEDVTKYEVLYEKGRKAMENELWDGEYFIQQIKWEGLSASDPVEAATSGSIGTSYSDEAMKLLQKEGPKYQYGKGCLSDGVIGTWMGEISGLKNIVDSKKIESHLTSVYKYNFLKDLKNFTNPQRASFALGHEGGLVLCTWPKGGSLSLPFIYSNEVWTGIEYQVASHLMLHGQVKKGLDIVRACRDRYDGRERNPFDEFECGHYYARAMSSYALLQGLTGARYDAVDQVMYINSHIGDFTSFLSAETGFGNVGLKNGKPFFNVVFGELNIKKFIVSGIEAN